MKYLALLLAGTAVLATTPTPTHAQDDDWGHSDHIKRVLLISVDGMHAVDYLNCSRGVAGVNNGAPYCPNLAALGSTGVNYVAASTSRPSDSFPGLMALMTGGTPRTVGAYYDVAYDRSLDAPAVTTGDGVAGHGSGHGIIGMRERVTLLGGSLSALPTADGGYAVAATIPFART